MKTDLIQTKADLVAIDPVDFIDVDIPTEEILRWFDLLDAYWEHDGDPLKPHAELTTGKCSNGFFDFLRVLKYINLSDILANQHARKIRKVIGDQRIDWTIGSPVAGITYAHDVGRCLKAIQNMCAEKDPSDPKGKRMMWRRMPIPEGETVLQIEELTTTSFTLNEVERAIKEGNKDGDRIIPVNFLPYVAIGIHRPEKLPISSYGTRTIIPLIERAIWAVEPGECDLCREGSKRLRPKMHWKELTGKA